MYNQNFANTLSHSQSSIFYQSNHSNNSQHRLSSNMQFYTNKTKLSQNHLNNKNQQHITIRSRSTSKGIIRYKKPVIKFQTDQRYNEYYNFDNSSQIFQTEQKQLHQSKNYFSISKPSQVQNKLSTYTSKDSQVRTSDTNTLDKSQRYSYQNFYGTQKSYLKSEQLLSKKSTVDTENDQQTHRQKILEDIQKKFKTPRKIQDLLNYLSKEFEKSTSNYDSMDEESLLSSSRVDEENWRSKTDDGFYSHNKQKKFSLVNKTYSKPLIQSQSDQKFNLQFYCVFDKLNKRKYSDYSLDLKQNQKLNEYKTEIDKIDTQKFLQEVKMAFYLKDINYYRQQLRK